MQAAFVLEDQDEENGCTTIVPGSHRLGTYTDREFGPVRPLHSKPGDIVIWDSRLWHGTLPNKSNRTRWSFIATFTSWWVKPAMDATRSLPDEIYRELRSDQKALLGFCSIPPANEMQRSNTKCGYDALLPSVRDYYD